MLPAAVVASIPVKGEAVGGFVCHESPAAAAAVVGLDPVGEACSILDRTAREERVLGASFVTKALLLLL